MSKTIRNLLFPLMIILFNIIHFSFDRAYFERIPDVILYLCGISSLILSCIFKIDNENYFGIRLKYLLISLIAFHIPVLLGISSYFMIFFIIAAPTAAFIAELIQLISCRQIKTVQEWIIITLSDPYIWIFIYIFFVFLDLCIYGI